MHIKTIRTAAFTLVELLVVVAIITVLAALLLPTLQRAIDIARTARCVNNERQIAVAMLFYADEHDGFLPTLGSWGPSSNFTDNWWQVHVSPYAGRKIANGAAAVKGTIFECPNYKLIKNPWIGNNYATNSRMARGSTTPWTFPKLSRIRFPARTLMVGDAGVYGGHVGLGDQYDRNYYSIRHDEMTRICVVYVDSHSGVIPELVLRDKKQTIFTAYSE